MSRLKDGLISNYLSNLESIDSDDLFNEYKTKVNNFNIEIKEFIDIFKWGALQIVFKTSLDENKKKILLEEIIEILSLSCINRGIDYSDKISKILEEKLKEKSSEEVEEILNYWKNNVYPDVEKMRDSCLKIMELSLKKLKCNLELLSNYLFILNFICNIVKDRKNKYKDSIDQEDKYMKSREREFILGRGMRHIVERAVQEYAEYFDEFGMMKIIAGEKLSDNEYLYTPSSLFKADIIIPVPLNKTSSVQSVKGFLKRPQ